MKIYKVNVDRKTKSVFHWIYDPARKYAEYIIIKNVYHVRSAAYFSFLNDLL
jgi:hypothetical protein